MNVNSIAISVLILMAWSSLGGYTIASAAKHYKKQQYFWFGSYLIDSIYISAVMLILMFRYI